MSDMQRPKFPGRVFKAVVVTMGLSVFGAMGADNSKATKPTVLRCEGEFYDNRNESLAALMKKSDYVVFGRVEKFEYDEDSIYIGEKSGTYTLILQDEFYGEIPDKIKFHGREPYTTIPQFYFDITEQHSFINFERAGGLGTTSYAFTHDEKCFAAPKLIVGYAYLVFGNLNSDIAYEPINSANIDPLFREVRRLSLEGISRPAP